MSYLEYLESSDLESSKTWALVEFASWCCASECNLATTISGKFTAVHYVHRLEVEVELLVTAHVVQCGYFTGPSGGGNPPPYSLAGVISHAFDREEGVMAVSMSEFFSVGTVGRDARRRFWGSTLCALPDPG